MIKINAIYRYPVKGFPAEPLTTVNLTAGEGLPDDRRYAITNGISDTQDGAWLSCRSFFINAVNDGLLKYANESDADSVTLAAPGGMRLSWKKGDEADLALANRKLAEFIAPLMPAHDLPVPAIAERNQMPGMLSGYWDFTDSAVSIMNTASMEAISTAAGKELDPRRLRGNLYLSGLPAWEEFAWLGKRIRIGKSGPELEILRPAQRCPATSVNPDTGERDIRVPDILTEHFGHAYCGMYAKVMKDGVTQQDAEVEIVGEAKTPFTEAANPQDTPYERWPKFVEIIDTEMLPSPTNGQFNRAISIRSIGHWPLPEAKPGQRMRVHIGQDLSGVATIEWQRDHTTVLHVEPSATNDPATAFLLEKVQTGDRLIVTGPFGRG